MAMMEIRNVHKTFRTYAKAGLRPGAHKVVSELPVLQGAVKLFQYLKETLSRCATMSTGQTLVAMSR